MYCEAIYYLRFISQNFAVKKSSPVDNVLHKLALLTMNIKSRCIIINMSLIFFLYFKLILYSFVPYIYFLIKHIFIVYQ